MAVILSSFMPRSSGFSLHLGRVYCVWLSLRSPPFLACRPFFAVSPSVVPFVSLILVMPLSLVVSAPDGCLLLTLSVANRLAPATGPVFRCRRLVVHNSQYTLLASLTFGPEIGFLQPSPLTRPISAVSVGE